MGVLYWGTPAKAAPPEEWEEISADGAPPGVWTPNMSRPDMLRWKAKLIRGKRKADGMRIEVRKTVEGAQLLMVVFEDGTMQVSANGKLFLRAEDWMDMKLAVAEARDSLKRKRREMQNNGA